MGHCRSTAPAVLSPSTAPQPGQGVHRRVCLDTGWFCGTLVPQHGSRPCSLHSPALPGPCMGQGLPLAASSRSSRGTGPAGGRALHLSPHGKSGDFQALGKKQELAAGDSSRAHPDVELLRCGAHGMRAPKLPSLSPFPEIGCLTGTSCLGRAGPGGARLFSRGIAPVQGQTEQDTTQPCPHASHHAGTGQPQCSQLSITSASPCLGVFCLNWDPGWDGRRSW